MRYDTILFDADNTLFDYDKAEAAGFRASFEHFGLHFEKSYHSEYRRINQEHWAAHERGEIDKDTLVVRRYEKLFDLLGINADAAAFNAYYLERLGQGADLIDGALEICERLSKTHRIAIVTNGVSAVQYSRIKRSAIKDSLPHIFVSSDVGFQKPQVEFFEHVLRALEVSDKSRVLIVGDSLSADMKGGNNSGINTCWFNPLSKPNNTGVFVTYEIKRLSEIEDIVY